MKLDRPEESDARAADILRWGSAGLVVVGLHAGLGWWVARNVVPPTPPDTVQGIPIDLQPVAASPTALEPTSTTGGGPPPEPQVAGAPAEPTPQPATEVPPDVPPTPPDSTASIDPEPPKAVEAPPEPPPPALSSPIAEPPPAPVESPQPVEGTQLSALQDETPPTVQPAPEPPPSVALPQKETKSDAVLAPPAERRPPVPDRKAGSREAARRKAEAEKSAEARAARAEARAQARATAREARAAQLREAGGASQSETPPSSVSSGASIATWRGAVQAHLRSFTPSGTGTSGTARVSFSVDRSGRVVAAGLASSSGDSTLDSAAVAMVRRASPVPAPPPELGGRVSLSVPVRFQ